MKAARQDLTEAPATSRAIRGTGRGWRAARQTATWRGSSQPGSQGEWFGVAAPQPCPQVRCARRRDFTLTRWRAGALDEGREASVLRIAPAGRPRAPGAAPDGLLRITLKEAYRAGRLASIGPAVAARRLPRRRHFLVRSSRCCIAAGGRARYCCPCGSYSQIETPASGVRSRSQSRADS
jgi:hypothetical protein